MTETDGARPGDAGGPGGPGGPARLRWLNRAVLGVAVASLLSDAGHEAATSALPALLVSLGAAPLSLGVIEGVADGVVCAAKLWGGSLANRPALRKPLATAGLLLTALSIGGYAVSSRWAHVLLARCVGWLARGIRSPARAALLADAAPAGALGRAVGFHRAMDTAGAVIGPAAMALLAGAVAPRQLFVWAMVPGVLAAVVFGLLVRPERETPKPPPRLLDGLRALPPQFRGFLRAVALFGTGDFARSLLILRATQLLAPRLGAGRAAALAMALYAGHNAVAALASYPLGRLTDRGQPAARLLCVGYALGAVTAVLAAVTGPSVVMLGALFALSGLVVAFEETLESVITAEWAPRELRGSAYGALAATNGLGDLVSSALVGALWTLWGPGVAFSTAGVLCAAGTWALWRMCRTSAA